MWELITPKEWDLVGLRMADEFGERLHGTITQINLIDLMLWTSWLLLHIKWKSLSLPTTQRIIRSQCTLYGAAKLYKWLPPPQDSIILDIVRQATHLEKSYSHYFDHYLPFGDINSAHRDIVTLAESLRNNQQWVPAAWIKQWWNLDILPPPPPPQMLITQTL
jgi:hypothetical protein